MKKSILILVLSLLAESSLADIQNLDEVMARKSRFATATVYSGESAPNYFIQPETLNYTDTVTGHEVWRLAFRPNSIDIIGKEHGLDGIWSADGSLIGIKNVPNTRASIAVQDGYDWVLNPNGSKMRKVAIGARSQNGSFGGFGWANTQPGVIYRFQSATAGGIYKGDQLWKYTLDSNNDATGELILDINDNRTYEDVKHGLSGDDSQIAAFGYGTLESCSECPNTSVSTRYMTFISLATETLSDRWGIARGCGPAADPYGDHTAAAETSFHAGAVFLLGPSGNSMIGQYSTGGNFWQLTRDGHYADGGPAWEDWDGDSFGVNEDIRIVSDGAGTPNNPYGNEYWGHPAFDKWGTKMVYGDYDDITKGTRIGERENNWNPRTGHVANPNTYDGSHHNWAGWTDWIVANQAGGDLIYTNAYTDTTGSPVSVVDVERPNISVQYTALPRPVQSPDGTKIVFHTTMFHSDYDGDIDDDDYIAPAVAVAYYPHPPEIISVTGTGTYTIRFDWRTDQATSRGYTQRGWPDEAVNDPPPPRETKSFRLWRSDNSIDWQPVKTIEADIFSKYNFATGAWTGNKYWEFTDTPGSGTLYYAVTAIEHSGLESRVLSNVFSITGTQTSAYPADPKAGTGIVPTYNVALKRNYNIYAEDGIPPAASQINRVATIPAAHGETYVDWLGNPAGTTQYVVTAVDTQGNESTPLDVTVTHKAAPATADGQYTLTWTNDTEPPVDPPVTPVAGSASLSGSQGASVTGTQAATIQ